MLSNVSAKGQRYRPLCVIQHIFSLYFAFRSTHTFAKLFSAIFCLRKTYTEFAQRLLYQHCPAHCWAVDAHSFAPPHTTFDYSVRRAFVVPEGRSCSHGNVLGCEVAAPGYIKGKHTVSTASQLLVVKERSRDHSGGNNYSCGGWNVFFSCLQSLRANLTWTDILAKIKIKLLSHFHFLFLDLTRRSPDSDRQFGGRFCTGGQ